MAGLGGRLHAVKLDGLRVITCTEVHMERGERSVNNCAYPSFCGQGREQLKSLKCINVQLSARREVLVSKQRRDLERVAHSVEVSRSKPLG
jgi:hypothetical protein